MKLLVRIGCAAAVLIALGGISGCAKIEEPAAPEADAAQIQPIKGTDLNRVVLTPEALENLGVQTQPAREDTAAALAAAARVRAANAAVSSARSTTPSGRTRAARAISAQAIARAVERRQRAADHAARLAADVAAQTIVPLSAVIYDPEGEAWVYTSTAARTFTRTGVVIDHATADYAYLSSGPKAGSAVVTVGASELLGAEYGVGGE